jgi:hypothetical protein
MDWSDNYAENFKNDPSNLDGVNLLNKIIDLWHSYASMEIQYKQWKKASEVFEKAINDPIAGSTAKIHELFADFYFHSRNKPVLAQGVLIKGLTKNLSKVESDRLWCYFLAFMRNIKNTPELTYEQLHKDLQTSGHENVSSPPNSEVQQGLLSLQRQHSASFLIDFAESNVEETTTQSHAASIFSIPNTITAPVQSSTISAKPVLEAKDSISTAAPTATSISVPVRPSLPPSTTISVQSTSTVQVPVRWFDEQHPLTIPALTTNMSSNNTNTTSQYTPNQLIQVFRQRPKMLLVAPSQVTNLCSLCGIYEY